MATVERTEKVIIEYDGNKIVVKGTSFDVVMSVNTADLTSIYMSGKGESEATLIVEMSDESKKEGTEVELAPPRRQRKVKTLEKVLEEVHADKVEHEWDNKS
jgi:hypothetical protein